MPLHLLGKKSWNVYNAENIARVRRDEAQAQAREEEEERRMQEIDAERRIQILRGERPSTPPPPPSEATTDQRDRRHGDEGSRYRKRRRIAGENDTDRDIRFAKEDAALSLAKREELLGFSSGDAPLVDSAGHINLFPEKGTGKKSIEKNAEAEAEASKKKREFEDQYTMRFSNAAGFKESVGRNPWYSSSGKEAVAPDSIPDKDVWGNEDPRRREREKARVDTNDPLAMMKKGVRQLKEVERERKKWQEEKIREDTVERIRTDIAIAVVIITAMKGPLSGNRDIRTPGAIAMNESLEAMAGSVTTPQIGLRSLLVTKGMTEDP
ncbi:conserved hypothetical protein [Paecilomyces variotii No. 5]|uniref:CBF1-interacting co-repressor CIR N-terminal domain-containing protein n=1 Tax=Byssochlamys spectabilis (strain No. 5 / NBRC 109023) TaxID=1356009 RepID=V5FT77_BYSSN|nr:conserved hypothetical protein [Paecilomyces variotii No. 5]